MPYSAAVTMPVIAKAGLVNEVHRVSCCHRMLQQCKLSDDCVYLGRQVMTYQWMHG